MSHFNTCTTKGAELVKKSKTTVIKVIKVVSEETAKLAGVFVGKLI